MLKLYCRACGSPNEYTLEKPKSCTSCGKGLLTTGKTAVSKGSAPSTSKGSLSTKHITPIKVNDDDVDEEEREKWSKLDLSSLNQGGLEIDIEFDNPRKRTEVLGEFIDRTQPKPSPKKRGRPKGSKNKPKGDKKG